MIHTQRLDVPGGHISYALAEHPDATAKRPPVVLLHGGALDRRLWTHQLTQLSRHHTVVAPDARGHGASSTPTSPFRQCEDIAALIRHLHLGPAVLVGVSMGAGAAVDTALEYPQLVSGIVSSGAGTNEPIFDDPWTVDLLRRATEAQQAFDAPRWIAIMTEFAAGPDRKLADLDPAVVDQITAMMTDTVSNHVRPDAVTPQHVTGSWDRLGEIEVPVLVIAGERDAADHLAMSERLAEGVADGRAVRIANTAHYPMLEQAAEWNQLVDEFLASLGGNS